MDRRINTRVVDTAGAALGTLIDEDASEIYWISVSPQVLATQGLIQIYDGFDAAGKLVWQLESGFGLTHNFIPPITCNMGIYITTDDKIACYSIAWRPLKWGKVLV